MMPDHRRGDSLRPIHALHIAALKTAPAFEVALYSGLRAAEASVDDDSLRQFSTYVGEGYQILNDLADWEEDADNKVSLGQDVVSGRPTVLRALALEAGAGEQLAQILEDAGGRSEEHARICDRIREVYSELGVFDRAEVLYARLRERADALAGTIGEPPIQELMRFLVRNVLPKRGKTRGADAS